MRKFVYTFVTVYMAMLQPLLSQVSLPEFIAETSLLFAKNVSNGGVYYNVLKENPAKLNKIVNDIKKANITKYTATEKKCFYINAYNVLVIWQVVQHYPVKSPKEIKGFFDAHIFEVAGESLSLNEIENAKIRNTYNDPRVHFALVCAANGCPRLSPQAIHPKRIETQLTTLVTEACGDLNIIMVNDTIKKVLLSEIFKWYANDFKISAPDIISYINKYRAKKIPSDYTVDYFAYDWSLNEKTGVLPKRGSAINKDSLYITKPKVATIQVSTLPQPYKINSPEDTSTFRIKQPLKKTDGEPPIGAPKKKRHLSSRGSQPKSE